MISLSKKKVNKLLMKNMYSNITDTKIKQIKENISNIKTFSPILEVESIFKTSKYSDNNGNNDINSLYLIKTYESFMNINNYYDLECPCCGKKGTLHFHKAYTRNIIFYINGYEITGKIKIIVVKCVHCTKHNKKQKYHAILPNFILPYHPYSSYIIISALYDKKIMKMKLEDVLEKYNISKQLLYIWIKKIKQHLTSCSILLSINKILEDVISEIFKNILAFLDKFYEEYHYPFFLFNQTYIFNVSSR